MKRTCTEHEAEGCAECAPARAPIEGIKLIRHNAGRVNLPDDPSYPFRLDAVFSPPDFMNVAFALLYGGTEEICVRGMTREALERFVEANGFRTHIRLRRLEITEPEKPPSAPVPAEGRSPWSP